MIGAGSGGLVVAGGAASLGLKTALIEKGTFGGDCLNFGCVPSKALIHAASLYKSVKDAEKVGLNTKIESVDFGKVIEYVNSVQRKLGAADSKESLEKQGIKVYVGSAQFIDNHTLSVNGKNITAKKICISTGSRASIPPIEGLLETGYLTNETIFSVNNLPPSLIVIGGGPIGLEISQSFCRFGSKVTVLEVFPQLFVKDDHEISSIMQKVLSDEGVKLQLVCKIMKVYKQDGLKAVIVDHDGKDKVLLADEILVSAGRTPNIEGLNLQNAGIKYDKRGITVDNRLRTSSRNIWACGDVTGPYQFTHMAGYQAGVVIANMLNFPRKVNYELVPWCTFTDPEVANVGLTEKVAKQKGIKFETVKFNFSELDRAVCDDAQTGFLKMIISRGKIIGASCIGKDAGNIMNEVILAASSKSPLMKISGAIHIYPTLSAINQRLAGKYLGKKYGTPFSKMLARFMFRIFG